MFLLIISDIYFNKLVFINDFTYLPIISDIYFIIKGITRILIIFKKPRKMTNDFFNNYVFVHMFQWTSSECLTNVTVTVKVAMVTYRHCKKG